jgi:phosphoribosylformylglycinamidine cyclo-ligase
MPTAEPAYAQAGVNQVAADEAVDAIVKGLKTIALSRPSRQILPSGHFANVIQLSDEIGIALSTDGVGTKLLIAEELGSYDTVGIDCIAMNVNDVICVGAEPLALLDYIAIDHADPKVCEAIGIGLARGAELAEIEIPGGELAQLGDMVRGFDLAGACFGVIDPKKIVAGQAIKPGDSIIGLPSRGLHANGYTLARSALEGISLDDDPEGRLGSPLGEVLIKPTEIYVKPVMELLRSDCGVHGLAHITSLGFDNLLRLHADDVGYVIENPLPVPPIFQLIQERGSVSDEEMREVFNLGCGFCCVVAAEAEERALNLLRKYYPEVQRIGNVVTGEHAVSSPANWPSAS